MSIHRTVIVLLASVLALSACGDNSTDQKSRDATKRLGCESSEDVETVERKVNGWAIRVERATGAWSLSPPHSEKRVLSAPPSCTEKGSPNPIRLGSGDPEMTHAFGNFRIKLETLQWQQLPETPPSLNKKDGELTLTWGADNDDKLVANLKIRLSSPTEKISAGEMHFRCGSSESFFGLGTQVTGMDLRGGTYPLWTQEQGHGKTEDSEVYPLTNIPEAAYAPMGIWYSSMGYTAIQNHSFYTEIDLCESNSERVKISSYKHLPAFVLVSGETPKERLESVTEYTGRLNPEPPSWVFGPWLDAVGGPWRIDEVIETARANEIPASAVWTEDWAGADVTADQFKLTYQWSWDEDYYPKLPSRIDQLHDNGVAFLAYFNPFVPKTVPRWEEAKRKGYLLEDQDGDLITFQDPGFRQASMVDLSDMAARNWVKEFQIEAATELGIDGWMADYSEWWPPEAKPDTGTSSWAFHNQYPLEWQKLNRESLSEAHLDSSDPGNNWAFFARSGWASTRRGTGGIVPTLWGGDQNTNWGFDDGFPSIIPIGTHVGLSGVPIFGSDIAGYNSVGGDIPNTDKELFFRWSATAAFHPLMRTHHGNHHCSNWSFDRDEETIAHFKRWASIHTLLYPYFKKMLAPAIERGLPMTRHPYLVEPDKPQLWSDREYQFFLGDDLLIGPVLEEGSTRRTIKLPSTGWWPLFGNTPLEEQNVTRDVPVTETPVFVRPGTVLPLLSEAVDSFYGASKEGVKDLGDVENELRLALYPDKNGRLALSGPDGLRVEGTQWQSALDWENAAFEGQRLPRCQTQSAGSCVDTDDSIIRLDEVKTGRLSVGRATLNIESENPVDLEIGLGGKAWGKWSQPTELTDLKPDVESQCADKPEGSAEGNSN